MSVTTDPRRFGGVGRLFGEEGARRLAGAHVAVVGLDQFLNFTVGGVNPLSGTEAPSQLQQQLLDAAADASSSDAAADADSAAAEPEA